MFYFAYGSNLSWKQIKERVPSVSFYGRAKLENHRLDFTRKSKNRNCGVADIVEDNNHDVWGTIYRFDERGLGNLDRCEGYFPGRINNAYKRIEKMVLLESKLEKPMTVYTYEVVNKKLGKYLTNELYKNLILEGAKSWQLPEEYIEFLEKIKTA
jgi:gamma-glutamylcyclotransferase